MKFILPCIVLAQSATANCEDKKTSEATQSEQSQTAIATDIAPDALKANEVDVKIVGMTCMGCAKSVEKELKKIKGLAHVKVELSKNIAKISFKNKPTNFDQVLAAVKAAGYQVESIQATAL